MWGEDREGLLATGTLTRSGESGKPQFTPRRVFGGVLNDMPPVLTPSPLPGLLRDASDVAVGAVVFRDGTVRTWGGNSFGSLGTGGSVDANAPRGVLVRSLAGILRVWAGGNRVLALKSDGTLCLWGVGGPKQCQFEPDDQRVATA